MFSFIEAHADEHRVVKMCELLQVSRAGYYRYLERKKEGPSAREKKRQKLDQAIRQAYLESRETYGSPRIHAKLIQTGWVVSQKTVANRMKALGLASKRQWKRVGTTDSSSDARVYPNALGRAFQPENVNEVWATDITYIPTLEGPLYFNPVLDLCSKRILAYRVEDHMRTELPKEALQEAIALRRPAEGWIHHSDRGSQYTSKEYVEVLKQAKAVISMSAKGDPYDNACLESFFSGFKQEFLYRWRPASKEEARQLIADYVHFYNEERLHSTLGYDTPVSFECKKKRELVPSVSLKTG
ncbi:IS3 family transposase [Alkalicoccus luteus]|uniref:IS3 family transposase n=1 Tax=Alkalicoccus luteus TaxID=1237094 RepID=UPI001FE5EBA6|nr:IS3 family transposase [Alkalicoccus luteus]